MSIYLDRTLYFYVIQEVSTNKYYAGIRWAKNCHPLELLQENGYKTSSKIIQDLIKQNGLTSFCIKKIKIFKDKSKLVEYEKRFLKKVDAKNNFKFYNMHNGDMLSPFGSQDCIDLVKSRYNVNYFSQHPTYIEKVKDTSNKKFGKDFYTQTAEYKQRCRETSTLKYNVDHYTKSTEVQKKKLKTNLSKYGCAAVIKNPEIKEKMIKTIEEKYGNGIHNISQSEIVKERKKETNLRKRGVDNPSKDPIIKELKRQNQIEKSKRECVKKLKELCKKHSIPVGNGWHLKSDDFILNKILEIENNHVTL
jgi:hypothetical protein